MSVLIFPVVQPSPLLGVPNSMNNKYKVVFASDMISNLVQEQKANAILKL